MKGIKGIAPLLAAIYILFFSLLILSGLINNTVLSDTAYYLAFLIPSALGISLILLYGKSQHGTVDKAKSDNKIPKPSLFVRGEDIPLMLSLVIPSVAVVFSVSVLTSLILSRLGIENTATLPESFAPTLLTHALFPAIAEELLFRYIPLTLFFRAGLDTRRTVALSAVLFALSHMNPYQIPYALIAGIILVLADIYFDSVLPSVIIHLTNNLISLIMMYGYASVPFYVMLSLMLLLSVSVFIYLYRSGKVRNRIKKQ
ncbi:MAG: CPBP family intramembrane metalloprotease [Clostridia bacterium]|nr:CPBP family intramembrane metalloprotease [Clostridia bacterium]